MADEIKRGNFMYAVFKINSDSSSIVLEFAQVVTTINQNDRNDLRSQIKILEELELLLPINECRYILYSLTYDTETDPILISWLPEDASNNELEMYSRYRMEFQKSLDVSCDYKASDFYYNEWKN